MKRKYFRSVLLVVALIGIGLVAGVLVERATYRLDKGHLDLIRVAWAVDLNTRLSMLRLLRQYRVPETTVLSVEIDAVALLNTMDAEHVSPTDQSYSVMERVVKNLRQYRRDFPSSEFDPKRHAFIARVLDKFPESQSPH